MTYDMLRLCPPVGDDQNFAQSGELIKNGNAEQMNNMDNRDSSKIEPTLDKTGGN
jgi:hypothetical protein